jgi:Flp pilus assembly protein TadG
MCNRNVTQNHGSNRQRGIAIIEFTIVLPVMLFLILVVAEFGRAFMYYNTLTRAVSDSARYVSVNALKGQSQVVEIDADLREAAQNLVDYGNVSGSGARVLSDGTTGIVTVIDQGDGVISVTASYPYTPMLGNILPTFRSGGGVSTVFTMQAQVTMRAI